MVALFTVENGRGQNGGDGRRIDLVVEHDDGARWAIEIKRSLAARVGGGFHLSWQDLERERAFVVHGGDDHYALSESVESTGLRELAGELRSGS